jgi:hypothetical protein
MFTTFSSVSARPSPSDVLREVEDILNTRDTTLGALIVNALRDTTTALGASVISSLASIFEALRPHFDEDEKARALLGRFFASITSPELLRFEKGDGEVSWNLPAASLSTEQLMKFSLEGMGKKIASDAPGLSSFLGGICSGGKQDDCAMDVDEKSEDDAEDDPEFGTGARRKVTAAQRLEIVRSLARRIKFTAHAANRERLPSQVSS